MAVISQLIKAGLSPAHLWNHTLIGWLILVLKGFQGLLAGEATPVATTEVSSSGLRRYVWGVRTKATPLLHRQCVCTACVLEMEVGCIDDEAAELKGDRICITCQHLTYGVDLQCRTILGCKLKRQQLQQGEHLLKRCEHWSTLLDQSIAG